MILYSIIFILVVGILELIAFWLGARLGNSENAKEIKIQNPISKAVKNMEEYKETRDEKKERERFNVIRDNIDNYDGTSNNQKDIP